jgi:hypothetical protein
MLCAHVEQMEREATDSNELWMTTKKHILASTMKPQCSTMARTSKEGPASAFSSWCGPEVSASSTGALHSRWEQASDIEGRGLGQAELKATSSCAPLPWQTTSVNEVGEAVTQ